MRRIVPGLNCALSRSTEYNFPFVAITDIFIPSTFEAISAVVPCIFVDLMPSGILFLKSHFAVTSAALAGSPIITVRHTSISIVNCFVNIKKVVVNYLQEEGFSILLFQRKRMHIHLSIYQVLPFWNNQHRPYYY